MKSRHALNFEHFHTKYAHMLQPYKTSTTLVNKYSTIQYIRTDIFMDAVEISKILNPRPGSSLYFNDLLHITKLCTVSVLKMKENS